MRTRRRDGWPLLVLPAGGKTEEQSILPYTGAACAGVDGAPWEALGISIGEAYQVADDIQDAIATPDALGKPCHQDEHLGRPNAVAQLGVQGAARRLRDLIEAGLDSIPNCPGREQLVDLVRAQSQGFVPKGLSRAA